MFLKLCSTEDIPAGAIKQFDLKEEEILVVNLGDQFFCLEARCSHAGAPLAEGSLQGDILTCPWHYSQFKITDGSVVRGPANVSLKVYRMMVKEGQLLVEF
jgi:nitrite reductase/ring-hydroxylating ferredoxin subunit